MKPLLVTSGEPAGIGPDICLALSEVEIPLVVLGNLEILQSRAVQLGKNISFSLYEENKDLRFKKNHLTVWSLPCSEKVIPGQVNIAHVPYVIDMLTQATDTCLAGEFSALVTAPIHKAIINEAGYSFSGHTEFLAQRCRSKTVVMMLASKTLRVALVTTHLPLQAVPNAITKQLIVDVVSQLHASLKTDYKISSPIIKIAGLNPHAGESGYLGREEIDIIIPAIKELLSLNIAVEGPFPADTLFAAHHHKPCDAYVAMYHDQGLPVLKYAGFGEAVNITLGLPIIRTSVDHGTALDLAGKGLASAGSLKEALILAAQTVRNRMA